MLLYSEAKAGTTPAFLALACTRVGTRLSFERLNVDAALPSGPQRAYLVETPTGRPVEVTVHWPGLTPGLYNPNGLEVT